MVGIPELQHSMQHLGGQHLEMGWMPLMEVSFNGYEVTALVDMGAELSTVSAGGPGGGIGHSSTNFPTSSPLMRHPSDHTKLPGLV